MFQFEDFPEKSGIYCIINLTNNKRYIGSAVDLKERAQQHYNELQSNKHFNIHLQRAWNLRGENNFSIIILKEYKSRFKKDSKNYLKLLKEEDYYINLYDSIKESKGYNKRLNSSFPILSQESIEKRKQKQISRKIPLLGFDKDSGILKKEWESVTDAAIDLKDQTTNISWAKDNTNRSVKGYVIITKSKYDPTKSYKHTQVKITWSKEQKQKFKQNNPRNIKIYTYDEKGNFKKEYYSCTAATEEFNISNDSLSHLLRKYNLIKYKNIIFSKEFYSKKTKEFLEKIKNIYIYIPGKVKNQYIK